MLLKFYSYHFKNLLQFEIFFQLCGLREYWFLDVRRRMKFAHSLYFEGTFEQDLANWKLYNPKYPETLMLTKKYEFVANSSRGFVESLIIICWNGRSLCIYVPVDVYLDKLVGIASHLVRLHPQGWGPIELGCPSLCVSVHPSVHRFLVRDRTFKLKVMETWL